MEQKTLSVSAIKDGTVIDHISAGHALKIVRLLDLASHKQVVTIGLNLPSGSLGVKDIIKVAGKELSEEEADRVAMFAPQGTVNIIKDFQVVKKFNTRLPSLITHIIVCPNPKCITNHENIETKFKTIGNNGQLKLQCHYCEKIFLQSDILEYKNN